MLYNAVLVFAVQQRESVTIIYIYILSLLSLPLNSASTAAAIRYPGKAKGATLTRVKCHAVLMEGVLSATASSPTFHVGHVQLLNTCLIPAGKLFENLGSKFWLLLTTSTLSDM